MFIAILKKDYDSYGCIYNSYEQFAKDTFSPDIDILSIIPLKVSGKTYQERKEDLRNKAVEWSNVGGLYCDCSWNEAAIISNFFETSGRRYGLLKEFQENGIC